MHFLLELDDDLRLAELLLELRLVALELLDALGLGGLAPRPALAGRERTPLILGALSLPLDDVRLVQAVASQQRPDIAVSRTCTLRESSLGFASSPSGPSSRLSIEWILTLISTRPLQ